jgi:uncharacterized protein YkwD
MAAAPVPASAPAPVVLTDTSTNNATTGASGSSLLVQLSPQTSCALPGMREEILARINLARSSGQVCGTDILPAVPPLVWNDMLFSAAAKHSIDMAGNDYFSHNSLTGIDFGQRLSNEGYNWSAAGENIAAGQPTAASVAATWLASVGHCRNIMNPLYSDVAVACVVGTTSTYGMYWTMDLGAR